MRRSFVARAVLRDWNQVGHGRLITLGDGQWSGRLLLPCPRALFLLLRRRRQRRIIAVEFGRGAGGGGCSGCAAVGWRDCVLERSLQLYAEIGAHFARGMLGLPVGRSGFSWKRTVTARN